jgi:hypothetical protein
LIQILSSKQFVVENEDKLVRFIIDDCKDPTLLLHVHFNLLSSECMNEIYPLLSSFDLFKENLKERLLMPVITINPSRRHISTITINALQIKTDNYSCLNLPSLTKLSNDKKDILFGFDVKIALTSIFATEFVNTINPENSPDFLEKYDIILIGGSDDSFIQLAIITNKIIGKTFKEYYDHGGSILFFSWGHVG